MLKNLILACFTLAFGFALIETFLYLVPSYQAGEPLAEVVFCTQPAHERQADARFGETATPKSIYFRRESEADGWYLRAYNEDGFRDLLDTGSENVLIFGDSLIEGESVDNDRTIGFQLDSWNPDLAFQEFALGGWGTIDQGRAYDIVADDVDHRLVILGYFVGNDLVDNLRAREQPDAGPTSAALQARDGSLLFKTHVTLRANSRAYSFFFVNGRRTLLEWLGEGSLEERRVSAPAIKTGAEATRQGLVSIAETAKANGAEVLIVTIPSWNEFIGIKGEQRLAAIQRDMIDAVAADHEGVHVLDLKAPIENAGYEDLFGNVDKHLNEEGYHLAATAIHYWVNGIWRKNPTAARPVMATDDDQPMHPDCAAVPRYLQAFSRPAASRS